MYKNELIENKAAAWAYAMEYVIAGMSGARWLRKLAAEIKDQYYTNGLWNPDAEIVYLYFMKAAEMAASHRPPNPHPGGPMRPEKELK